MSGGPETQVTTTNTYYYYYTLSQNTNTHNKELSTYLQWNIIYHTVVGTIELRSHSKTFEE